VDVIAASLIGVAVGFGLGWARDWWNARPRVDVKIGVVRSVYALFVAMMQKYAWMQCDETAEDRWVALLVVLNVAVLNESGDDAIAEAEMVVRGPNLGRRPRQDYPEFAAKVEGGVLHVPAMVANERRFLGHNLPAHSLTDVRLVFEIYRSDLTESAWTGLLDSKPQLTVVTIRGAKATSAVNLRRTDVVKRPWPKDRGASPVWFPPPIKGYERFQERYEVFGSSYQDTYFGKKFTYPEQELW
jgi:hypothetical protein